MILKFICDVKSMNLFLSLLSDIHCLNQLQGVYPIDRYGGYFLFGLLST